MAEEAKGQVVSITVRKVRRYMASSFSSLGGGITGALREVLESLPGYWYRNSKTRVYIVDAEALREFCKGVSCKKANSKSNIKNVTTWAT
jgi:hypothetical protein